MADLVSRAVSDANNSPSSVGPGARVSSTVSRQQNKVLIDMSVSGGPGSTIDNVSQRPTLNLADREYYFQLALRDSTEKPVPAGALLRAGENYTVSVTVSLAAYTPLGSAALDMPLKQHPIKIDYQERFFLFVGESEIDASTVEESGRGVIFDIFEFEDWKVEYAFRLSGPSTNNTIRILLAAGTDFKNLVAELMYMRAEPVDDGDRSEFKTTYIPSVLPKKTAILYVTAADADHIRLSGFVRDQPNRRVSLDPIERPKLSPKAYESEVEYLLALRDQAFKFALDNRANLSAWVEDLINLYGDDCIIVVLDTSDSEIAWEMFRLSDGRHLGAVATVVRWTEALYFAQPLVLSTDEESLSGRFGAYVNKIDWDATKARRPVLARLKPMLISNPDDLDDELLPRPGAEPVALVYLGYGGLLVSGDEDDALARLGAMQKPYDAQVRLQFYNVVGRLNPRPVFLVDSAFSGRVLRRGQKLCGLAQAILTQVAGGYIGTLGPVDRKHAAKIAEEFLSEAEKGVQPATLLRRLRAEAEKQLLDPQIPKKEREANFLQAFMYVYYGNPLARLQVNP